MTENGNPGQFKPGHQGGRPKGVPNKATAAVREAIAAFAEANVPKLQAWLDATAAKDPARAAELLLRALEYHVPKLARTEFSGEVEHTVPQIRRLVYVRSDGEASESPRVINGEAVTIEGS
jgi:hypothetical protein